MTAGGFQMLLDGAWTTIWISLIAIVCGVPIGFGLSLIRVSRVPVLSQIVVLYVSLGRATPLVTLALFLFVTLPVFGINIDKYTAGVMALTLNTASFNTEVWRSALPGVSAISDRGGPRHGHDASAVFPAHHVSANVVRCPAVVGQRNDPPDQG